MIYRMALVVVGGLLLLLFAGCARQQAAGSEGLTSAEQQAVQRLGRDRWLDVQGVRRNEAGELIAQTLQGDERIDYRIRIDDQGEARFERLPRVTFGSH